MYGETEVDRLKQQLSAARYALLDRVERPYRDALWTAVSHSADPEKSGWRHQSTWEKLLELIPEDQSRVMCPLCGEGAQLWPGEWRGPSEPGFAVPIGIERHWVGGGNSRHCATAAILQEWMNENSRPYFQRKMHEERQKAEEIKRERLSTEIQYQTRYKGKPELRRCEPAALAAREARLIEMGFKVETTAERIRTYIDDRGDHLIYGDPAGYRLTLNVFSFRTYKTQPPQRRQLGHLSWPDHYKNKMKERYENELARMLPIWMKGKEP
jgi:hypothetical protein